MSMAEIPQDGVCMTVIAFGETGAKVLDSVAAEWPDSARQVQWWCYRVDYKAGADPAAGADSGFRPDCIYRTGAGPVSQEEGNGIPDRVETLVGWETLLKGLKESEYIMILVDQKQRFDFLAAACLAKMARGQGCSVIGLVATEESGDGEALREARGLFRETTDCLVCLPRPANQSPESLLWPAAREIASSLAVPALIKLDLEDLRSVFENGKNAYLGMGSADVMDAAGESEAFEAVDAAEGTKAGETAGSAEVIKKGQAVGAMNAAVDELLASPAFTRHVQNASGLLFFFTCPPFEDMNLLAVDQALTRIGAVAPSMALFAWNLHLEESETDRVRITAIAAD